MSSHITLTKHNFIFTFTSNNFILFYLFIYFFGIPYADYSGVKFILYLQALENVILVEFQLILFAFI